MTNIEVTTKVIMSYLGAPYYYGGQSPMQGIDCSGLIVEGLRASGIIGPRADYTADSLAKKFPLIQHPVEGTLICRRKDLFSPFHHIQYCLDTEHMIGAEGGNSKTKSLKVAIQRKAFVRIQPIVIGQYDKIVDPFFMTRGYSERKMLAGTPYGE